MHVERIVEPTVVVLFGVAGDLSWRLITPALFDLFVDGRLPPRFLLMGFDRADHDDQKLRDRLREGIAQFARRKRQHERIDEFLQQVRYHRGDLMDPEAYLALAAQLDAVNQSWGAQAQRAFYAATPPRFFEPISAYLGAASLNEPRERSRIVIEKPIGHDLLSARAINAALGRSFKEKQIFRIDHYLGKETTQNILAFRFANPMFEPIWDRRYVECVTISVAESLGVERRAPYYEQAGALRDMVQNHLLQLLCLVAMEPPVSFAADEIRNKKMDVLHAIRPIHHDQVAEVAARGQYGPGWIDGQRVVGYRQEEGVAQDSPVETFAALRLFIDNWRWQGVPFYLRTGKRMAERLSEVIIQFRSVPHRTFPAGASLEWRPARLRLCLQPYEGIVLEFMAKQPGLSMVLRPVEMRFDYAESFSGPSPSAYETLLFDVMKNDTTLFMRADQVETGWSVLQPVLEVWGNSYPTEFPDYAAGTWGPYSASTPLIRDGFTWPPPLKIRRNGERNGG
jgi:glucose-6-phosphate 1-dehydrogenase